MKFLWLRIFYTFVFVSAVIFTGMVFNCADVSGIDGLIPDYSIPMREDFLIRPSAMALFTEGGEKRITALLPDEISAFVDVEWSIDKPDIAELAAEGASAVVIPKADGEAVITARLKPKDETIPISDELGEVIEEIESSCTITVLSDFTLDKQRIDFFEGEPIKKINAVIPAPVLAVAEIKWSLDTANPNSFTIVQEEADSIEIEAFTVETMGLVTATLMAKDPAAFNGSGRTAACVITVSETPEVGLTNHSYTLNPAGGTLKTALITATYSPDRLDAWNPEVTWESGDLSIAQFNGQSSASMGKATTHIILKKAGTVPVTAILRAAGYSTRISADVIISPYQSPDINVTSLVLDNKPNRLMKSERSVLISAAVSGEDGNEPSNPEVEWEVSETGVVEFEDAENSIHNDKKYLRGVWTGSTAKGIVVTARSVSNPEIFDSFFITVSPIIVTVVSLAGGGSTNLSHNTPLILRADVAGIDTQAVEWSSSRPDLITITPQPDSENVQVSIKPVLLLNPVDVVVTAVSVADYISSGSITITLTGHTFQVRYHKNDGTSIQALSPLFFYGTNTQNLSSILQFEWLYAGHTFIGWSTSNTGPLVYRNEALISALNDNVYAQTPDGTVDLYAKWIDNMLYEDSQDFGLDTEMAIIRFTIHNETEWQTAVATITNFTTGNFVINLGSNFTLTGTNYTFGDEASASQKIISIRGTTSDRRITLTASSPPQNEEAFFITRQNQHIILWDVQFDGGRTVQVPFIRTYAGSTFEMKRSTKLSNIYTRSYANITNPSDASSPPAIVGVSSDDALSPVIIGAGSHFIMRTSAAIEMCEGIQGGGVYIGQGGAFTMQNHAVVSSCFAPEGGSIYNNGGYFIMQDQSIIIIKQRRFNYQNREYGAVYINNGGTFTMNNTTYIECSGTGGYSTSAHTGGGVYMNSGSFVMNGDSKLFNLRAQNSGGGVYMSGGSFTMNDAARITDTRAKDGGGVYVSGGLFTMNGSAAITNCGASGGYSSNPSVGGGVLIINNADFTMNGNSEIAHCFSEAGGAGITADSGATVAMNDSSAVKNCYIDGLYADGTGGVYIGALSRSFTMSGNTVIAGCRVVKTNSGMASSIRMVGGLHINGTLPMVNKTGGVIYGGNAPDDLKNVTIANYNAIYSVSGSALRVEVGGIHIPNTITAPVIREPGNVWTVYPVADD